MKKRICMLLLMILGVCASVAGFSLQTNFASATSVQASVWDGLFYDLDELGPEDIYTEDEKNYEIRSAKGFSYLANAVNGLESYSPLGGFVFKLMVDIDLKDLPWIPIGRKNGTTYQSFRGTFDGNGHTIFNLNIVQNADGTFNSLDEDYDGQINSQSIGLFGVLTEGAKIINLRLDDFYINVKNFGGEVNIGGLVGDFNDSKDEDIEIYKSEISNVSLSGEIVADLTHESSASANIGGVAGYMRGVEIGAVTGAVKMGAASSVKIAITDTVAKINAGGLFGSVNYSKIYNSHFDGSISTINNANLGGIVGYGITKINSAKNVLKNVYNTGSVAIVGKTEQQMQELGTVGSVAGYFDSATNVGASVFEIENAYSVDTGLHLVGGIASPSKEKSIIKNAMNLGDEAIVTSADYIGAEGLVSSGLYTKLNSEKVGIVRDISELARSEGFYAHEKYWAIDSAWDFENVWSINSGVNGGLPYIDITTVSNDMDYTASSGFKGRGTFEEPYLIETPADLSKLSYLTSYTEGMYYSLQNDIDLTGLTWVPIGLNSAFSGVFDGNNHTISGMTCSLNEKFEYHTLFAKTNNAVIKDLKIENVRFANYGLSESVATKPSSILGIAQGTTYLINVLGCDSAYFGSSTTQFPIKEVTNPNGNLTVFYGKNNGYAQTGLEFGNSNYSVGYDITIDGNGGTFYGNNAEEVYQNYRVLVDKDFELFEQSLAKGFAKNLLPSLSEDYTSKDILIKPGYKLKGFDLVGNKGAENPTLVYNVGDEVLSADACAGLVAIWTKIDAEIEVIYNKYEMDCFGATDQLSTTYKVDYDGILDDYSRFFNICPDINNEIRPGFKIEDVYETYVKEEGSDGVFSNSVYLKENDFVNSSILGEEAEENVFRKKVYAKWIGDENYTNQIRVVIKKTDERFYKNFNLEEVIKAVTFNGLLSSTEDMEVLSNQLAGTVNEDGSIEFSFGLDTRYSDSKTDYLNINVELEDGYVLSGNMSWTDTSATNHGVYVTEPLNQNYFGNLNVENSGEAFLKSLNTAKFYNISEDYLINLTVQREQKQKEFSMVGEAFYSIAPIVGDYEYFQVWDNDSKAFTTYEAELYSKPEEAGAEKVYIGYNILGNYLMSSKDQFDMREVDEDYKVVNGETELFIMRYYMGKHEVAAKDMYEYYIFERKLESAENEDGTRYYNINLYQSLETENVSIVDWILDKDTTNADAYDNCYEKVVTLQGKYDGVYNVPETVIYLAKSNFMILFSTEIEGNVFTNWQPYSDEEETNFDLTLLQSVEENVPSKVTMKFTDFIKFRTDNFENSDPSLHTNGEISVVTMYTTAYMSTFEFYEWKETEDGGKELVRIMSNAPKIKIKNRSYEVDEPGGGLITFDILSSNYYRFIGYGKDAVIYNNEGYNIQFEVSMVNMPNAAIGETEEDEANNKKLAEQRFEANFEANNSAFISASVDVGGRSVSSYEKGYVKDFGNGDEEFTEDTARITLKYNEGTNANGEIFDNGLQAGSYKVKLICEEVLYSLNVGTRFVDKDDLYTLDTEGNSDVLSYVGGLEGTQNGAELLYEDLRYDDEIALKTEFGENNGYVFYGWYQVDSTWTKVENEYKQKADYISTGTMQLTKKYYDLNNQNGKDCKSAYNPDTKKVERFSTLVYAIYQKKEVDLAYPGGRATKYMVKDFNNTGEDRISTNPSGELNVDVSIVNELDENGLINYVYSVDTDDSALFDLQFTLSGLYADAYDVIGYAIVDTISNIIQTPTADGNKNMEYYYADAEGLTLYEDLKAKLEKDASMGISTKYYIMPILKQKRLSFVFHSGTGDESNIFGDKKNGQIFDVNDTLVDNLDTYVVDNVIRGQNVDADIESFLRGEEELSLMNILFQRKGYQNNEYGYFWTGDNLTDYGSIISSTIDLYSERNDGDQMHFYRIWDPCVYTISFDTNNGSWINDKSAIEQTYDAEAIAGPSKNDIKRTGYNLVGWAIGEDGTDIIFDENGALIDVDPDNADDAKNALYDKDGCYVFADNVTLYAVWEAKTYKLQIMFNGANAVNEVEIPQDDQLSYGREYSIVYDTNFDSLTFEEATVAIEDLIPEREGFTFSGIFAADQKSQNQILNDTKFDENVLTFVDNTEGALILYAKWVYVPEFYDLSVTNTKLSSVYNSQVQTVLLRDYFGEENFEAKNITPITANEVLEFEIPSQTNSKVEAEIINGNATAASNMMFSVKNVGKYSVTLSLSVVDNSLYLNNGEVWANSFEFEYEVTKAPLTTWQQQASYVSNAKRLMQPFFAQGELDSATTLLDLASKSDATISASLSSEELYEYLMIKYYLLLTTNNGALSNQYRAWTYEQFVEYKQAPEIDITATLENLKYFDFYSYLGEGFESLDGGYVKDITEAYPQATNFGLAGVFNDEISISSVKVFYTETPKVFYSYDIRVYISNATAEDKISNYQLNYDEEGYAYLVAGKLFVVPEVLDIANLGPTSSYYQASKTRASILWQGDRASLQNSYITYYLLDTGLYLKANMFTSNGGRKDLDTVYSYFDSTNYIYFDEVEILNLDENNENYKVDKTSYFKLRTLDEYTILNIAEVVQINLSSLLFTSENNYVRTEAFDKAQLLITSVKYVVDEQEKEIENVDGLEVGSFVAKDKNDLDIPVYEILTNNSHEISIYVNSSVTSITFVTPDRQVDQYASLYKWTKDGVYWLDGTMETNNSVQFDFEFDAENKTFVIKTSEGEEIVPTEGILTSIDYYAVFTDLVLVNYDLSLPEGEGNYTQLFKLGETKYSDIRLPDLDGLELASLTEQLLGVDLMVSSESLFRGTGATFVGLSDTNRFTPLNIVAKWRLTEFDYTINPIESVMSVYTYNTLNYDDVADIGELTPQFYDYSFEWQYRASDSDPWGAPNSPNVATDRLKSESLVLNGGGSATESGQYKLTVTRTLISYYKTALIDDANDQVGFEHEFSLTFMKMKLINVFAPDTKTAVYDKQDKIMTWASNIEFVVYDNATGGYDEESSSIDQYYSNEEPFKFVITYNGQEVTNMINAGEYQVELRINEENFDVTGLVVDERIFTYNITPLIFDLTTLVSEKTFDASKAFNAPESGHIKNVYAQVENAVLSFDRQTGEDVGEYDMFLSSVQLDFSKNITFKLGETVLFENGAITAEAATTKLGTFTIEAASKLVLSYEVATEDDYEISLQYSKNGYNVMFAGNYLLIVENNTNTVKKSLAIKYYDSVNGAEIVSSEVLGLLDAKLSTLAVDFYKEQVYSPAINCNKYTYKIENSTEMSKYYLAVEFDSRYSFNITSKTIDVESFDFEKVFDGNALDYYDLEGNKISLDGFEGVYIKATYETAHAGNDLGVKLSLLKQATVDSEQNYVLSSLEVSGNITKLSATMTFNVETSEFEYGSIIENNLASILKASDPFDIVANGEIVDSLLNSDYYEISYSLPAAAQTRGGYVTVGEYVVDISSEFNDFDMTVNSFGFKVAQKVVNKTISGEYATISITEKVENIEETIKFASTGEVIDYVLKPDVQLTADGYAQASGLYDLTFVDGTYQKSVLDGNVLLVLNENNDGYKVVEANEVLYVALEDVSILTGYIYSGQGFNIVTDLAQKKVSIMQGETEIKSSALKTYKLENGVDKVETTIEFTTLRIFNLATNETTIAKDATTTKLGLEAVIAEGTDFGSVVFNENYSFEIETKEIDVTQFGNIKKQYDGNRNLTLSTFNEKISGDDLSVLVKFANDDVGASKTIELLLQGADKNNYSLSASSGVGEIEKATATIELQKTRYTYGELSETSQPTYTVTSNGKALYKSQYSATLSITKAGEASALEYSSLGYLLAGLYDVSIVATSANYNFDYTTTTITIERYSFAVALKEAGGYKISYGDASTQFARFETTLVTPLGETIGVEMTRTAHENNSLIEVGDYFVESSAVITDSANANYKPESESYLITSTTDTAGYYRILKATERLYLLLSDEEEIEASGSQGAEIRIEYDGNLYDKAEVRKGESSIVLALSNSSDATIEKTFALNTYKFDATSYKYVKTETEIENLQTSLSFYNVGKNSSATAYKIVSLSSTSDNYDLRLGKDNDTYSYYLYIDKKELYLTSGEADGVSVELEQSNGRVVLAKKFDNKASDLIITNASNILLSKTGESIVSGEDVGLKVKLFKDSGKTELAKYVGLYSTITVELIGEHISNYNLNLVMLDEDKTEISYPVSGRIKTAPIMVAIDSQSYHYGDTVNLKYELVADIDLSTYDTSRIVLNELEIVSPQYSTTGNLCAGEYGLNMLFACQDFYLAGFIINGSQEQDCSKAKLSIARKTLSLVEKDVALSEVFRKTFDGSTNVELFDEDGDLLFDISGLILNDDVTLSSAQYVSANISDYIQVNFELLGNDVDNYKLDAYMYGVIDPILVGLTFDYDKTTINSDVTADGRVEISQLKYPFMSSASLTANSSSSATSSIYNFPRMLYREGYTFSNWEMAFNVGSDSDKISFLEGKASGMNTSLASGVFSVEVGNNQKTVNFLNALIGEDENNLFGLYYKENSNPQIVFKPKYNVQKINVLIQIVDENGNAANRGKINLSYGGNNEVISAQQIKSFDYGTALTFEAVANEHYSFQFFEINSKPFSSQSYRIDALTSATEVVAVFGAQLVNVVYDLSSFDASVITIPAKFADQGNGRYKWATDFAELVDAGDTLQSILIEKEGYGVSSLSVTAGANSHLINSADFATTMLSDLIDGVLGAEIDVVMTPTFEANGVTITLDYGYDAKTQEASGKYQEAYGNAEGWDSAPTRVGHEFVGWWTASGAGDNWGSQIVDETIIESVENHTLYAKWTLSKYSVTLLAENATINDASIVFDDTVDGQWTAEQIEYGTVVSFHVAPAVGYMVSENGWEDYFAVVINADKSADVTLTVPAFDVEFEIPTEPETNKVTVTSTNLNSLSYTINEVSTDLVANATAEFNVDTDVDFKLNFEIIEGYVLDEILIDITDGLTINEIKQGDQVVGVEISGIYQNINISIVTKVRQNQISVRFDNPDNIANIEDSKGFAIVNIQETLTFEAETGSEITLYILYKTGYQFDVCDSDDFTVESSDGTGYYTYWTAIKISDIKKDGEVVVTSKKSVYTIVGQAVSYESDMSQVQVAGNIAYINGKAEDGIEIGQSVRLSYASDSKYNFAGWSMDGVVAFSPQAEYDYTLTIEDVEEYLREGKITIYAIFSKLQYNITFGTLSYYTVGNEYNDASKLKEIYTETTGKYFDEDGNEIVDTKIFYGIEKSIKFEVPNGYKYLGFGYKQNESFVMLQRYETNDTEINVKISSSLIEDGMKIYFVVTPQSTTISIENKINYDGQYEEDVDVGSTELFGANESYTINNFGYVEGTKVRYADQSEISIKGFELIAYSGDEIYLKIKVLRAGYKFQNIISSSAETEISLLSEEQDYYVYKVSNIIGGEAIELKVLFKPQTNIIDMEFSNLGHIVDGGSFVINTDQANQRKVFTSGKEYSSIMVSAYTDAEFDVIVLVASGFHIVNYKTAISCADAIIEEDSIEYEVLSDIETGFSGKLKFRVSGFLGTHKIVINLSTKSFTVNIKQEGNLLATIKNVEFDSILNLSENNAENITIVDERISFVNGKLNVVLPSDDKHNFEGYFTGQNGSGVHYINSTGDVVTAWQENGYTLDNITNEYRLTENAYIDAETGEIVIEIYAYWSYLKTRVSFEILPDIDEGVTAKDMVSGVDYTNSWFYASSPMYIEVAFDTDVYFTAPEFDGYNFYKFVISQKTGDGTWLTDVVAMTSSVPWSTNEFANIVECKVQIVYFAKVNIDIIGGEATYVINQDGTPKEMLASGFVDTSKPFTVVATPNEGYNFLYWKQNNSYVYDTSITISTQDQVNLKLYVQGLKTILSFEQYNATHGQITSIRIQSYDGSYRDLRLGAFSGSEFIKIIQTTTDQDIRVGDVITFTLLIDNGFGVTWNREDILYKDYIDGAYYFSLVISPEFAGQTIEILPNFNDEILSFFITRRFKTVSEDAVDSNYIEMAGHMTHNGKKVDSFTVAKQTDITLASVVNTRYKISNIIIQNYGQEFSNLDLNENGELVLSKEYLAQNNIIGTVHIIVEFDRVIWEADVVRQLEGKGINKNPYKINSEEDLALMMALVNSGAVNEDGVAYKDAHYQLQADLDLTENFWTPIGTISNEFNGEFDFGEFEIKGIYNAYFYNPIYYQGLFGVLGANANIHTSSKVSWYIYLVVGLGVFVVAMPVTLIVVNNKRRKKRQELAHK